MMTVKIFVLVFTGMLFFPLGNTCFGQSKSETVEWINSRGEEIVKEVTGHSSIYWELDGYGSFRITDFNPQKVISKEKEVVKIYSYLNLTELDSAYVSIEKKRNVQRKKAFSLFCKSTEGNCIKMRYDYKNGSLRYKELDKYTFHLKQKYNVIRAKELVKNMNFIISTYN